MTETEQRHKIRKILRQKAFDSKDSAKYAIHYLIGLTHLHIPTVNDLLMYLQMETLEYGGNWGWADLYWDILSVNYGIKTLRDRRTGKTWYILQLPPVEKLTKPLNEKGDINHETDHN